MDKIRFLRLAPIFKERIWGGHALSHYYPLMPNNVLIGEVWVISAHPHGDCAIIGGPFNGQTLSNVYRNNKQLFNHDKHDTFPLMVKLIDANDDLSIQVHPDDKYAQIQNHPYGKEEAWLILKASINQQIQLGHHARSHEELKRLIIDDKYDELLKYQPLHQDDFVIVKPGTIHAILKGTLLLEIQQSSDLTYRVYDYNRVTQDGKRRPLHLEDALNVIAVPDNSHRPERISIDKTNIRQILYHGKHFTIEQWQTAGEITLKLNQSYYLINVLDGNGIIDDEPLEMGDSLIITSMVNTTTIKGRLRIIVSYLSEDLL